MRVFQLPMLIHSNLQGMNVECLPLHHLRLASADVDAEDTMDAADKCPA